MAGIPTRISAIALGCVLGAGCGVSFQSLYEGNVRFEHCHRLDMDRQIAPSYRKRCWREWLDHYTLGQTRDRVDYARRRIRRLDDGDVASQVRLGSVDAGPQLAAPEAPVPTNVHAPPPTTATPRPTDAGGRPRLAASDAARPPAEPCVTSCQATWRACLHRCDGDDAGRCQECGGDYRSCMRRCFR